MANAATEAKNKGYEFVGRKGRLRAFRPFAFGSKPLVVIGVILYFVCVAAVLALCVMPGARARVGASLALAAARARAGARWAAQARWGIGPRASHADGDARAPRAQAHAWTPGLGASRVVPAAALLLVLAVPGAAWWLRIGHGFDGFDHTVSRRANAQLAALLAGEQLTPPPKLPPELFLTREVEAALPLAASANREWALLDGEFHQRLLIVFQRMREWHGYDMVLLEGYRSPQRQSQLAAMGPSVTRAAAGMSYHQHGLAADCAFLRDGRIVISEADPWAARGYQLFGEVAKSAGLTWGGSWRSLADLGHVELARPALLRATGEAGAGGGTSRSPSS